MFDHKRWLKLAGWWFLFVLLIACSSEESALNVPSQPSEIHQEVLPRERNGIGINQSKRSSDNTVPKQDAVKNAKKQGRKITYKATVSMVVEDYHKYRSTLEGIVSQSEGYLVNSREQQDKHNLYKGTFTYRIPQKNFQTFINRLKKASPDTASITINGNDVTEEMVDLNARLKAKKVTESRLLDLMKKATDSSALLEASRQLDTVQTEIEQIQGRLQYLNHRVDFSEVTISLNQERTVPAPDNASMVQKMKEMFIKSSKAMINIGKNLLILLAGIIPVIIGLGIIFVPIFLVIWYYLKKRNQNKKEVEQKQNGTEDR